MGSPAAVVPAPLLLQGGGRSRGGQVACPRPSPQLWGWPALLPLMLLLRSRRLGARSPAVVADVSWWVSGAPGSDRQRFRAAMGHRPGYMVGQSEVSTFP